MEINVYKLTQQRKIVKRFIFQDFNAFAASSLVFRYLSDRIKLCHLILQSRGERNWIRRHLCNRRKREKSTIERDLPLLTYRNVFIIRKTDSRYFQTFHYRASAADQIDWDVNSDFNCYLPLRPSGAKQLGWNWNNDRKKWVFEQNWEEKKEKNFRTLNRWNLRGWRRGKVTRIKFAAGMSNLVRE